MGIFKVDKLQPFSTTNLEILSGVTGTSFSGSFSGSFIGDGSQLSGIISYTDADTLEYINSLQVVSGSISVDPFPYTGSAIISGTLTVTQLVETSAREYKDNIVSLDSQIENIQKLNPVTFTWKGKQEKNYGFIADEVEQVYPELVNETNSGIQYSKMVSILVKVVQELSEKIEKQEKTISKLLKN